MKRLPLVYDGPRPGLLWVADTPNTKTGRIPTAYVGHKREDTKATCSGCSLFGSRCYAWAGFVSMSFGRLVKRAAANPERYTLRHAMANRRSYARAIRIGALGDPGRADPVEVQDAVNHARVLRMSVLMYTHFWRERDTQHLKDLAMASCEDEEGAEEALRLGWRPAMVLPWDHTIHHGHTFTLPSGAKGVVCPAQTRKDEVTCNTCRMCSTDHPVWKAGKIQAIGFLDHSRAAFREARRTNLSRQIPMFGDKLPDLRPRTARAVHPPKPKAPPKPPAVPAAPTPPKPKMRAFALAGWGEDGDTPCGSLKCKGITCTACQEVIGAVAIVRRAHLADPAAPAHGHRSAPGLARSIIRVQSRRRR